MCAALMKEYSEAHETHSDHLTRVETTELSIYAADRQLTVPARPTSDFPTRRKAAKQTEFVDETQV